MGCRNFFLVVCMCLSLLPACKKKEAPYFYESSRSGTAEAPVKEVPKDILATQQAFTTLVKTVTPAVVNISTVSKKKLVQPFFELSPFFEDFFGEGRGRPQYRRENSLGSGFIINPEGKLLNAEVNYYNLGRNIDELMRKFKASLYLAKKTNEACPSKWKDEGDKTLVNPGAKMVGKVHEALG